MKKASAKTLVPLTHTTYYILLSLTEPMHGYGIMNKVDELSQGQVKLGPGTLYGALAKLEKQGVIKKLEQATDERRKHYELTSLGAEVVQLEYNRLVSLVKQSEGILSNTGHESNRGEQ
ncbi:PadR family transcriptional regulator [Pontibacillus halophilus JSM 076056 = DSM 19796]|uniref:PadR family transcriptional regulator n=1 Tax=Pontibacillus halophilus JSM 076056 = DSM 19796 TaxID=1385510 RepID=A0A0A5I906_9BACI|nr:PadR family transcriptional regulator [Pontibacillus halophilus]KGX92322.1 PadR family transcriptional regulator [Pontibacillus halophilus JSM 076056 = DSM 19796]